MLKKLVAKTMFIFLWINFVCACEYSIVFVHLGSRLPCYVKDALRQARLFNSDAQIYLVVNKHVVMEQEDTEVIRDGEILTVWCEDLPASTAHIQFLKDSPLDPHGREGFWKKASERFFCLEELMHTYDLHHVFHLENDNMLYVDLKTLVPVFKTYQNIAAVFDNDDRCIPSFMYIAKPQSLTALIEYFAFNAKRGFTDMQIPALYKKERGTYYIDSLPIVCREYTFEHELKSKAGHTVKDKHSYSQNIEKFQSIFDAAALGQYLGGVDPRNDPRDTVGFINESCVFNPSYFTYEWIYDEQNRKVPYISYKGVSYRINNLHIHSKNLNAFRS